MFASFGRSNTRIGGEAVEMLEPLSVGPDWKLHLAQLCESLLKTYCFISGVRVSCGNGATDARIAAFECDFADTEANYTADFRSEESVLPESWNAVDLKSRAEAQARFGDCHSRKPRAHGIKRSCRDDCWTIRDQVVRDSIRFVPDHDRLVEDSAEPRRGGCGVSGKGETSGF